MITLGMPREKFATQVDTDLLSALRTLAREEGRQLQALVEEALSDLVDKHRRARPRPHVMAAYLGSHEKFGSLYQKLAE
jgi:Antitoxin-like ribbon-helix-helix